MKLNLRQLLLLTALAAIFCGSLVRAKSNKNGVERSPLYRPQPLDSNFNEREPRNRLLEPSDGAAIEIEGLFPEENPSTDASSDL